MASQNPIASETGAIRPDRKPKRSKSRARATQPPPSLFSKAGMQKFWNDSSKSLQRSTRTLRKRTDRLRREANKRIRKHPLQTLFAGVGVGLVFGILLSEFLGYDRKQES